LGDIANKNHIHCVGVEAEASRQVDAERWVSWNNGIKVVDFTNPRTPTTRGKNSSRDFDGVSMKHEHPPNQPFWITVVEFRSSLCVSVAAPVHPHPYRTRPHARSIDLSWRELVRARRCRRPASARQQVIVCCPARTCVRVPPSVLIPPTLCVTRGCHMQAPCGVAPTNRPGFSGRAP
jgi:hypothetical protein